jgi:PPOX class probable F420-dependent enzyme
MRRRVSASRVGHLATIGPGSRPHIVPITFALDRDQLFFAVDTKPKRTLDLQRVRNIDANPAVSVLVDHYEGDWDRLWWVRMDGTARVLTEDVDIQKALDLLAARYLQYRRARPAGPVVAVSIDRMSGWSASPAEY